MPTKFIYFAFYFVLSKRASLPSPAPFLLSSAHFLPPYHININATPPHTPHPHATRRTSHAY